MTRLAVAFSIAMLLVAANTRFFTPQAAPQPVFVLAPADATLTTATEKAADAWNEYLGHTAFIVNPIFESRPGGIVVVWVDSLHTVIDGKETQIAAGWFGPSDPRIAVSTSYDPARDCLRCGLAHELGHVLGIKHGDGPFGLASGPPEESVRQ